MRKIAGHKESWQTNTCQQVMTAINWQLRKKCGIKNERRTLESHGLGFLFNKIQNIIHLYSNSKIMIEKEIVYYKSTEQHKYKWQWHWQWAIPPGLEVLKPIQCFATLFCRFFLQQLLDQVARTYILPRLQFSLYGGFFAIKI